MSKARLTLTFFVPMALFWLFAYRFVPIAINTAALSDFVFWALTLWHLACFSYVCSQDAVTP